MKLDWNEMVEQIKKDHPDIRMTSTSSEIPCLPSNIKNESPGVYPHGEYTDAFGEDHSDVAGLPDGY